MGVEKKDDGSPSHSVGSIGDDEEPMEHIEYSQSVDYEPSIADKIQSPLYCSQVAKYSPDFGFQGEGNSSKSQEEEEEEKKNQSVDYDLGEHVDCRDSVDKWCNAEIVAVSRCLLLCLEKGRRGQGALHRLALQVRRVDRGQLRQTLETVAEGHARQAQQQIGRQRPEREVA